MIASYLMLVAVGFNMARIVTRGSSFHAVLAAVGMVLVPWTRIRACRRHFFISSAMLAVGVVPALAFTTGSVHPLAYPLTSWAFLAIASATILSVV